MDSSAIMSPYFLELASSKAASVSSRMINGGGFTCDMANSKAMEVRARSPPDSIIKPFILFLGRLTSMSIPSSDSSSSAWPEFSLSIFSSSRIDISVSFLFFLISLITESLAVPPPNILLKKSWNCVFIFSTPNLNSVVSLSSNSFINA